MASSSQHKILHCSVKAGYNLYDPNWVSSLDPYCVVRCGSEEHKTSAISKSKNPVWNQDLIFEWNSTITKLEFKVWDEDRGKDDFVGEAMLPLKDDILLKGFTGDLALFRKNGNKAGTLKVEITWKTRESTVAQAGTQLAMAAMMGAAGTCAQKYATYQNANNVQVIKQPYMQPQMMQPQMMQPQMMQAQPQMMQAQPQMVQAQPQMMQMRPQMVAQPQVVQAGQAVVMAQPMMMQQQPMMMQQQQQQPMMVQQQPMMMQQQQPMMMQQQPMMMQQQPMVMQQQPMMMQQQPMMMQQQRPMVMMMQQQASPVQVYKH